MMLFQNDIEQFTYNAAVVEYQTIENSSMSYEEKLNFTVHEYIGIVKDVKRMTVSYTFLNKYHYFYFIYN